MRNDDAGAKRRLTVNGQAVESGAGTLSALLAELAIADKAVVAEVNGIIVPPKDFAATALNDGDKVELVRFVGGG